MRMVEGRELWAAFPHLEELALIRQGLPCHRRAGQHALIHGEAFLGHLVGQHAVCTRQVQGQR